MKPYASTTFPFFFSTNVNDVVKLPEKVLSALQPVLIYTAH